MIVTSKRYIYVELMGHIFGGIVCDYHTQSHHKGISDLSSGLLEIMARHRCTQDVHSSGQQGIGSLIACSYQHKSAVHVVGSLWNLRGMFLQKGMVF